MSQDPFALLTSKGPGAAAGSSTPTPTVFGPLTAGLQQQVPAAALGWVSFDDGPDMGAVPAFPPPQQHQVHTPAVPGPPLPVPVASPAPTAEAAGGLGGGTSFSPLTSAAGKSTFPTFAALHASGGSAPPPAAAAATSQPTVNPFTSPAATAPTASSGPVVAHANPFAASVNPHGATAAARSSDPFADLAIKPPPPRPPPMGTSTSRRHVTDPFAAAEATPPVKEAVAPVFPSFAALHGQAPPPPPQAHTARATAGDHSPFPTFPAFAAAPQLPPPGAAPAAPAATAAKALEPASMDNTSFDAFVSQALHAAPTPAATATATAPAAGAAASARPPGYADALSMSPAPGSTPAAPLLPPPPPAYEEAVAMSPPPPPPPAYTDALAMPAAPSMGVDGSGALTSPLPPPGYDEARAMPSADSSAAPPSDVSLSGIVPGRPLPGAHVPHVHSGLAVGWAGTAVVGAAGEENWASFGSAMNAAPHVAQQITHTKPALAEMPLPRPPPTTSFGPGGGVLAHSSGMHIPHASPPPPPPPMPPPPLPKQVTIEVRLPPLKPKDAALPMRLAGGMGYVFAAPGGEGVSALQWMLRPSQPPVGVGAHGTAVGGQPLAYELPVGVEPHAGEDWDSAPAAALPAPPSCEAAVTCMLLDEQSGSLWTGHKDGKVARWSVLQGRIAQYQHHWKAHAFGKVTSLALTPWGELWTGASSGSVRAWQYLAAIPATRPPTRMFECRRERLARGSTARAAAPRPHSKVRLMAVGPCGRVVWTAGRSGLALWGAYDGEFLGSLTPAAEREPGAPAGAGGAAGGGPASAGATGAGYVAGGGLARPGTMSTYAAAYAGDTGAGGVLGREGRDAQLLLEINPRTGLEPALIERRFARAPPPEGNDDGEAAEADLGTQVFKGLAGAAKFAAKWGKKIAKNVGELQAVASGGGKDAASAEEWSEGAKGGGYGAAGGGASSAGLAGRGKVVALVPGLDGSMFVAFKNGVLDKYTEWGKLMWSRDLGREPQLCCAALVGTQLWLGCTDGCILAVTAAAGELSRTWKAFDFPVVGLAHDPNPFRGLGLVYGLSEHGSVRAWPGMLPDEATLVHWRDGLEPCLTRHQLCVLAGTWNVNETRPALSSLAAWLRAGAVNAHVVAIALQEVEMGTSSVAMDAARNLLYKTMLERGNQNAQWWAAELLAALTTAGGGAAWSRVGLRQMSGMLAMVFCRTELMPHVGEVATASVPCGVMGVGGNKGAVAVSMSVYRRRIMFVCSHFAAHQERVDERNDNYYKIVRQLHFENTSKAAQRMAANNRQQQQAVQQLPGAEPALIRDDSDLDAAAAAVVRSSSEVAGSDTGAAVAAAIAAAAADDGHGPGMADAAMLVWAGDFNYRINGSYMAVVDAARAGRFADLFAMDQCREQMEKGNVFRGLREALPLGHPLFVPTYKFDKGEPVRPGHDGRLELPYDTSEKQRVPAWTDRIFFRGSRPGSLDMAGEEVQVGVAQPKDYNCCLELNDSDHKPVYAILQVLLPGYKQDAKRLHSLAVAAALHRAAVTSGAAKLLPPAAAGAPPPPLPPPVHASSPAVQVRAGVETPSFVDLRNTSPAALLVHVSMQRAGPGATGGPGPLPTWLEVSPTNFMLLPADAHTGPGTGEPGQGSMVRVFLRAASGASEGGRVPAPVRLHFSVRPVWAAPQTLAGVPGPVVSVSVIG
ncbi:hypothetical protein HYH02_001652 [Chlamydomonas schloesseri]|uniref:Inositol polyphosphate-related phosphatase domain-containing protein n=1 Tax=Chlamydomonas schloesseri TaxID=2026947 RepID=A0A836BC36_9CHLO|nr:hypothetical protein HYH02_001652 [Chlamydomonas schloesseri]|eukprot:KAG2453429.1 hypothetical protein HYH02_001652 [Chlamydomonas schloesseri]